MIVVVENIPPGLARAPPKSSDSSHSRTTVLSARSFGFHMDSDNDSIDNNSQMYVALEMEWEALQKRYSLRDRLLRRMAKSKSAEFMQLLRRHEFKVRRQEYKQLFRRHFHDDSLIVGDDDDYDSTDENAFFRQKRRKGRNHNQRFTRKSVDDCDDDDDESSINIWFDACSESNTKLFIDSEGSFWGYGNCSSLADSRNIGVGSTARDLALFEWNTTAPAVMSLVVHCLGHAALYDGIEVVSEEFKKYCELYGAASWPVCPEIVALAVMFSMGLIMLRMSGFLYWWLNEVDFRCLKFDYHNRSRLGCWDVRLLLWVKRHPIFQALLYFTGYQLIFMVVNEIFYSTFYLFDQRQRILGALPSEIFLKEVGRFPAESVTNQPLDMGLSEDDLVVLSDEVASLLSKDIRYLWKKLIFSSFETFCYNWVSNLAGEDYRPVPLLTPFAAVCLCMCTIALSVTILKWYGFGVFEKY